MKSLGLWVLICPFLGHILKIVEEQERIPGAGYKNSGLSTHAHRNNKNLLEPPEMLVSWKVNKPATFLLVFFCFCLWICFELTCINILVCETYTEMDINHIKGFKNYFKPVQ